MEILMEVISACLVGCNCRYDGDNQLRPEMEEKLTRGLAIPVCPEQLGGLPTPRPPAEEINGKMITDMGSDVTSEYNRGAAEAFNVVKKVKATKVYLKSRSPMCGLGQIYDGTHTGTLTTGDGVFAKLLKNHGVDIEVID